MNAIKHGALAGGGVIDQVDGPKAGDLFNYLLNETWQQLAPVGFMEEELVYQIVQVKWRHRRLRNYETNLIRVQVDHAIDELEGTLGSKQKKLLQHPGDREDSQKPHSSQLDQSTETTHELGAMVEFLESGRPLTEAPNLTAVVVFLAPKFELDPQEIVDGGCSEHVIGPIDLIQFTAAEVRQLIDAACEAESINESDIRTLYLADLQDKHKLTSAEMERLKREYDQAILLASLPEDSKPSTLLRYETTWFNQLLKLKRELERLQAARRGASFAADTKKP